MTRTSIYVCTCIWKEKMINDNAFIIWFRIPCLQTLTCIHLIIRLKFITGSLVPCILNSGPLDNKETCFEKYLQTCIRALKWERERERERERKREMELGSSIDWLGTKDWKNYIKINCENYSPLFLSETENDIMLKYLSWFIHIWFVLVLRILFWTSLTLLT